MSQKADILVPCSHPHRPRFARGACGACYEKVRRAGKLPPLPPSLGRRQLTRLEKRAERLRLEYGLSLAEFDAMASAQGGRCAVCSIVPPASEVLHVDHDHETGAIRGLLCNTCNRALGMFGDDLDRVRAAVAYLEAAARRRLAEAG